MPCAIAVEDLHGGLTDEVIDEGQVRFTVSVKVARDGLVHFDGRIDWVARSDGLPLAEGAVAVADPDLDSSGIAVAGARLTYCYKIGLAVMIQIRCSDIGAGGDGDGL